MLQVKPMIHLHPACESVLGCFAFGFSPAPLVVFIPPPFE